MDTLIFKLDEEQQSQTGSDAVSSCSVSDWSIITPPRHHSLERRTPSTYFPIRQSDDPLTMLEYILEDIPALTDEERALIVLAVRLKDSRDAEVCVVPNCSLVVTHLLQAHLELSGRVAENSMNLNGYAYLPTLPLKNLLNQLFPQLLPMSDNFATVPDSLTNNQSPVLQFLANSPERPVNTVTPPLTSRSVGAFPRLSPLESLMRRRRASSLGSKDLPRYSAPIIGVA